MNTLQTEAALDVIERSIIKGNNLYLPGQIGRDLYLDVKKALEAIGGKWDRKTESIAFKFDPTQAIAAMINTGEANPKKKYQFFATPEMVGDMVRDYINPLTDNRARVLEPSAGDGALIRALWKDYPEINVDAFELWDLNAAKLKDLRSEEDAIAFVLGDDFLEATVDEHGHYSLIIANPPFAKNQDVRHVRHMMQFVAPGGQLISIMSNHWQFAQDSPSRSFRSMVEALPDCITVEDIPAGAFSESGTSVATCLFVFNG